MIDNRLSSDPVQMSQEDIKRHIKEQCRDLGGKFDVFEHAWDIVEQCCAHLRDDLSMANDMMVNVILSKYADWN